MRTLYGSSWGRRVLEICLLLPLTLFSMAAVATADPNSVAFTLEGCRNNGGITLPNGSGKFICPDSAYTTGNLGKGWNELDLVPHRVTAHAGTSAPTSQTYAVAVAADDCDGGGSTIYTCADGTHQNPGYDVISAPVLNTSLSAASCSAATSSSQAFEAPGQGGAAVSIYRIWTITQARNTTCVYDYYERLALGSHLYPGSALHSDLLNQNLSTSGIGSKEVSIPVKEIAPQELNKDMSATADATVSWEITKDGTPANVHFGDVCAPDAPSSQPATIVVTWTKGTASETGVDVTTHVYAKNPSTRTITVNVTDVIYQGTTQTTVLSTLGPQSTDVPANTTTLVMTHTVTLPASAGNIGDFLNDVATATYTDTVTGVPIPGNTMAQAQAQIGTGTIADNSADISDSESITGSGLTFSVPVPPSVGSFLNSYNGDPTTGPVDWQDLGETSGGSITFDKTIYLTPFLVTSGTLSDTAHLNTVDQQIDSNSINIGVDSTASVTLTVSKTIPDGYPLDPKESLTVFLHVSGAGGYTNDVKFVFTSLTAKTLSIDLPGLTPDVFSVSETSQTFCDASNNCTSNTLLTPVVDPVVVDLTPQNGSMSGRCSGTAAMQNTLADFVVKAQVQKVTVPALGTGDADYNWSFTLNLPGGGTCTATAGANAGYVYFVDASSVPCILGEGTYTATETQKTGWVEDPASPNDGTNKLVCYFTVVFPTDQGATKTCTFHNTRQGHVKVIKTQSGGPIPAGVSYQFDLRTGASAGVAGTVIEGPLTVNSGNNTASFTTLLVPGNHYQICEDDVLPGWQTNLPNQFVADSINSVICSDFVATTDVITFNVNNTPPVTTGSARTIGYWKNWASCSTSSGKQKPVLDQTLYLATSLYGGIKVDSFYLTATSVPATTTQCTNAVNLLSKSTMTTGIKMPSDPIFNMVAQLVAAELNKVAGSASCPKIDSAINAANALLTTYHFNGNTYSPKLSKADTLTVNNWATLFDAYNNNKPGTCP